MTQSIFIVLLILSWPSSPTSAFDLFSDSSITHHWMISNESSETTMDHSSWDDLVKTYIDSEEGVNFFSYGEVTEDDRSKLQSYLAELQAIKVVELNREQQLAYWINLYNALTVETILEHYPVDSITDISFSLVAWGPWKEKLVTVEGMALSLDDIEHKILRPVFKDNRIHYAVNCASIGCPNLQTTAFTAENLEALLNRSAKEYINHPRGVSVSDNEIVASKIYDWFAEDFGDNEFEIIQHFLQYAAPELIAKIGDLDEIEDYEYDWSLNE